MELFDCVNNLYSKRYRYPTDNELSGKLWVINKFISMEDNLLEYVAFISKYFFVLGNRYYRLLYRLIPMVVAPRNKYIKLEKIGGELVSRYSKFFGISNRETFDYLKILKQKISDKELNEFVGIELTKK